MNRRGLFKRIGAVAAVVAAAPAVEIVAPVPEADERAQAQAILDRWLETDEGRQTLMRDALAYRGEKERDDAYQAGLTAGLNGAIDRSFSIEHLATVTTASAEGTYVARMTDVYESVTRPRSGTGM